MEEWKCGRAAAPVRRRATAERERRDEQKKCEVLRASAVRAQNRKGGGELNCNSARARRGQLCRRERRRAGGSARKGLKAKRTSAPHACTGSHPILY